MKELWKIIEGWPGYKISNYGNVLSWRIAGSGNKICSKPRLLKQGIGKWGHHRVTLCSHGQMKCFPVQRLVAFHFIGPPAQPWLVVDHIDNDPHNNRVDNLQYLTSRENVLRGNGPPAKNKRKTHCVNGHEFTDNNLKYRFDGYRDCKPCWQKRKAKEKEARFHAHQKAAGEEKP